MYVSKLLSLSSITSPLGNPMGRFCWSCRCPKAKGPLFWLFGKQQHTRRSAINRIVFVLTVKREEERGGRRRRRRRRRRRVVPLASRPPINMSSGGRNRRRRRRSEGGVGLVIRSLFSYSFERRTTYYTSRGSTQSYRTFQVVVLTSIGHWRSRTKKRRASTKHEKNKKKSKNQSPRAQGE